MIKKLKFSYYLRQNIFNYNISHDFLYIYVGTHFLDISPIIIYSVYFSLKTILVIINGLVKMFLKFVVLLVAIARVVEFLKLYSFYMNIKPIILYLRKIMSHI